MRTVSREKLHMALLLQIAKWAVSSPGRRRAHLDHSPLGALMIYNLLLALVVIVISGYMMTKTTWFGIRWIKSLHEIYVTWAEISVMFHVVAVIYESRRLKINLAKSMIAGSKTVPTELHGK